MRRPESFAYTRVKRSRTTQKISISSGKMARNKSTSWRNNSRKNCCWSPIDESNLSGRLLGPRKNEPVAIKNPKHMRQRCRSMRVTPETPPRTSMRRSPAAASIITEPIKKFISAGTPSLGGKGLPSFSIPETYVVIPPNEGIKSASQSSLLVCQSARPAVSHAVRMR